MDSIENKVEIWKNKLLDLGKRNRLVYYKETKRSTLKIEKPEFFELWDIIVKKENDFKFPYYNEFDINSLNEDEENANIKTNQNIREMQKTLRNLREKAKSMIQEQGINVLYLAFGFLEWKENWNSEQSFKAPLILVPVDLRIESLMSPYILSKRDDEVIINPTLKYKLENDFGVELPEFTDEIELNLEDYLEKIERIISMNQWKIIKEVSLSLFSFLKINMYKDLEGNKEYIMNHPVIKAISGDPSQLENVPDDIKNFDFDNKTNPIDTFQVVDADSSQQEAIMYAKKGISFVLQGPPGTGKSQTITNIISECLASGKKILFVSEKVAALDVVRKRLVNAGLADFCLILHSYKANKREVMDQFEKTLELVQENRKEKNIHYDDLERLQEKRNELNQYAKEVYDIIEPFNKSIYEINGILAKLDKYEEYIFTINDIRNVKEKQYNKYIQILEALSNTINEMPEKYDENPWYESNVEYVSNELRHDIYAKIPILKEKMIKYEKTIKEIYEKTSLKMNNSYENIERAILIYEVAKKSPIVPSEWLKMENQEKIFDEINEYEKISDDFKKIKEKIQEIRTEVALLNPKIKFEDIKYIISTLEIENEKKQIINLIHNNKIYNQILNLENMEELLKEEKITQMKINNINYEKEKLLRKFDVDILKVEYEGILDRYRTDYQSITRYFKKSYKKDMKKLKALYINENKKFKYQDILPTLNSLKNIDSERKWLADNVNTFRKVFDGIFEFENTDFEEVNKYINIYNELEKYIEYLGNAADILKKIEDKENEIKEKFSFYYEGIETSWRKIREALSWSINFKKIIDDNLVEGEFPYKVCEDKEIILECEKSEKLLKEIKNDIDIEFKWFLDMFDNKNKFMKIELNKLIQKLEKCNNDLSSLEKWSDFRRVEKSCQQEGLDDYVNIIKNKKISPNEIVPIFQKRFFRLWLDSVLEENPAVREFRGVNQEKNIEEFVNLDKEQFKIAQKRIRARLINNLEYLDDDVSMRILKRELKKKKKIKPLRGLFEEISGILLKLKPCLMMSPLSVSLYLKSNAYKFDTVIFDEASQVRTENAIGAIFRGKQVIIAGDSKQLPPTNFFEATYSESDYDSGEKIDEQYEENSYESVLDEANLLPEKTLLWHYRSRHEHLIAFSNAKIYKNKLITFPSNKDRVKDNGVEYVYVKDGRYDSGGRNGNEIEANKVAELVFEHYKNYPKRSLGVIAFGSIQQQAIETALRKIRLENQEFENFFDEEKEDAFFIKNLENVQGDERDTIIFSIGYAKDLNGIFRMNFGPLSKSGGERRLNVAITRAKYNVKLVGSILPTDIDINRISSEGPKLLRSYIEFAKNGPETLNNEICRKEKICFDSPFEESVYQFLDENGYDVSTQVGCSGYRIDLAVKNSKVQGEYIIGIECDGASYHSAKTARERDRLRQEILENMGWKIYRIWSTDWIKDSRTEGRKLIDAIENAKKQ